MDADDSAEDKDEEIHHTLVIICGYCVNPQIKYIYVFMYSDYCSSKTLYYLAAYLFLWDESGSLYL